MALWRLGPNNMVEYAKSRGVDHTSSRFLSFQLRLLDMREEGGHTLAGEQRGDHAGPV